MDMNAQLTNRVGELEESNKTLLKDMSNIHKLCTPPKQKENEFYTLNALIALNTLIALIAFNNTFIPLNTFVPLWVLNTLIAFIILNALNALNALNTKRRALYNN